jgi:CRISPR-associated protein (TIGR03985 family)
MPYFKYKPTPEILQALIGSATPITNSLDNLNKSIRLWSIMRDISGDSDETPPEFDNFLLKDLIDRLYIDFPMVQGIRTARLDLDKKPPQNEGCKSIKKAQEILFKNDTEWNKWKDDFRVFYNRSNQKSANSSTRLEDILKGIELQSTERYKNPNQPFFVVGRTIAGDLKSLEMFINSSKIKNGDGLQENRFTVVAEFPELSTKEKIELADAKYLKDDFNSYVNLFAEPVRNIQRFFINSDDTGKDQSRLLLTCQNELMKSWSSDKTLPINIVYDSASLNKYYETVIYPACIFYNQRGFYLSAKGECQETKDIVWHNYRIDRIKKIDTLDWHSDMIPQGMYDECFDTNDQDLITDEIERELYSAYGFDFYQGKKEMIIRFNQDFNDRFIEKTFRHDEFREISFDVAQKLIKPDCPRLSSDSVQDYVYYKLPYRVDDNTVIMRLRAWGQNVEVLSPLELRKRMRDDIEATWAIYQDL